MKPLKTEVDPSPEHGNREATSEHQKNDFRSLSKTPNEPVFYNGADGRARRGHRSQALPEHGRRRAECGAAVARLLRRGPAREVQGDRARSWSCGVAVGVAGGGDICESVLIRWGERSPRLTSADCSSLINPKLAISYSYRKDLLPPPKFPARMVQTIAAVADPPLGRLQLETGDHRAGENLHVVTAVRLHLVAARRRAWRGSAEGAPPRRGRGARGRARRWASAASDASRNARRAADAAAAVVRVAARPGAAAY